MAQNGVFVKVLERINIVMGTNIVSPSHANGHITYERATALEDDKLIMLSDTIAKLKLKYGNKKFKKGAKKDLWMPV